MKRVSAIICVIMMAVALMAPAAFAAEDTSDSAAAAKTDLELVYSSPEDGATGVAVDNLSVKMRFNKDVTPASDDIRKSNAKQFKMVDAEGSKIPVKVYYSEKDEGMILVAADVYSGGSSKNSSDGTDNGGSGKSGGATPSKKKSGQSNLSKKERKLQRQKEIEEKNKSKIVV